MCFIHVFRDDPSVYNNGQLYSTPERNRSQHRTAIFSIIVRVKAVFEFSANQIITSQLSDFPAAREK